MRTTIYGLALLGAALSAPRRAGADLARCARPQPAGRDHAGQHPPGRPAPAPADRGGATSVGPTTEGGQAAVRVDEGTRTAGTPQPGANSFTEGQARSRIEAAGFSNVTELTEGRPGDLARPRHARRPAGQAWRSTSRAASPAAEDAARRARASASARGRGPPPARASPT